LVKHLLSAEFVTTRLDGGKKMQPKMLREIRQKKTRDQKISG